MYDDLVDDPKVQRLPHDLFKTWVNLLCVASKNDGKLPDIEDMAFSLRMTLGELELALDILVDRELLDEHDDGSTRPHNWDKRQFKSDTDPTATDRQRKKRERGRSEDVTRDKSVTSHLPETEADTEQNIKDTPRKARVQSREVDGFDAFWDEYPRKTAKGAARQAFIKAQAKVENGHLLEAARRYAASKPDPKFTPHPATWLNQERWLDVDCSAKALVEPFTGTSNGQVFVKQGTDAFDAWTDVWKKKSGKSPPVNQNGGWFFPTEYPEEESAEQAA
jgi:hypothetical protein